MLLRRLVNLQSFLVQRFFVRSNHRLVKESFPGCTAVPPASFYLCRRPGSHLTKLLVVALDRKKAALWNHKIIYTASARDICFAFCWSRLLVSIVFYCDIAKKVKKDKDLEGGTFLLLMHLV